VEEVRALIVEQANVLPERVTPETRLLHDLGIDGDDAVELLLAFEQRFGVDLAALQFGRHFGPEGIPLSCLVQIWAWMAVLLFAVLWWPPAAALLLAFALTYEWRRWRRREGSMHPLHVRDLVEAASAGRWVYPYEQAAY
jgi:acyl carrier protein